MIQDARPKPTKHQQRLYLGLSRKLIELSDLESEYFWRERPWLEDRDYPKPWTVLTSWEPEKALLKKKIGKVWEEVVKLRGEMYPPDIYPEKYVGSQQLPLVEGFSPIRYETKSEDTPANRFQEYREDLLEVLKHF